MSDADEALLQEVHAPWEYASQLEHGGADPCTTVHQLLDSKSDEVIATLQRQGVSKLGEFRTTSDLIFPAFGKEAILTLGSRHRNVDYENLWGRHLHKGRQRGPQLAGWSSSVVVEAFVVNVKGAAKSDDDGLLQPLLKRYQAGAVGLPVFGLPAVQAVVEFKWHRFARRLLLAELACFLLWLASFFAFTILFQDEDDTSTLPELLASRRGRATVAAELLALMAMSPFLVLEWGTITAYRGGWFSLWNGLDVATYILQVVIAVLHLSRHVTSGYVSIACSLQCILLLLRLQYFSRVFTATRFAFLEAVKEAIRAIYIYLLFMLLLMLGYAVAFHVLFRKDQQHEDFATITNSFLSMYANQNSLLDLSLMRSSHNPVAATLLAVSYAFVMGTVVANMLIGLMANALEKTGMHEGLKILLHKASIIDELEITMPSWLRGRFNQHQEHQNCYPDYIHILRVDPDRLDKPDLDSMWLPSAAAPEEGGAKPGEGAALAAKLEAMQAQLARLEALLLQQAAQQQPAGPGAAHASSSTGTPQVAAAQ